MLPKELKGACLFFGCLRTISNANKACLAVVNIILYTRPSFTVLTPLSLNVFETFCNEMMLQSNGNSIFFWVKEFGDYCKVVVCFLTVYMPSANLSLSVMLANYRLLYDLRVFNSMTCIAIVESWDQITFSLMAFSPLKPYANFLPFAERRKVSFFLSSCLW